MHRNTFIFVIILAIFSAVVAGVNISQRLNSSRVQGALTLTPTTAAISPSSSIPSSTQKSSVTPYENAYCGVSLSFDASILQLREEASNAAMFLNAAHPENTVILGCGKDIPRPALPESSIEMRTVASISATIYHDSSAKDGSKIDAVIFSHPKKNLDIYIAGYGKPFEDVLKTVTVK